MNHLTYHKISPEQRGNDHRNRNINKHCFICLQTLSMYISSMILLFRVSPELLSSPAPPPPSEPSVLLPGWDASHSLTPVSFWPLTSLCIASDHCTKGHNNSTSLTATTAGILSDQTVVEHCKFYCCSFTGLERNTAWLTIIFLFNQFRLMKMGNVLVPLQQ